MANLLRGGRLRLCIAGVVAILAIGLLLLAVQLRSDPTATVSLPSVSSPSTFVTIGYRGNDRSNVLQLRDRSDGHVVGNLTQPTSASLDAARAADGSYYVAQTSGCSTALTRLTPGDKHPVRVTTTGGRVSDMSVSPNGEALAFMTSSTCVVTHCPGVCSSGGSASPNVLVVLDLSTLTTTRATEHFGGNASPSWSPDGARLVANYIDLAGREGLMTFTAVPLEPTYAQTLTPPTGCAYGAPSWTNAGILATEGCTPLGGAFPSRLVMLSPDAQVTSSRSLPSCAGGVLTRTDSAANKTIVEINVGYNNCGDTVSSEIAELTDTGLRTILNVPESRQTVTIVG